MFQLGHLQKDLLLWTSYEVLYWLELNETFNHDIQLKYRVERMFCDAYFWNEKNQTKEARDRARKKSGKNKVSNHNTFDHTVRPVQAIGKY